MKKKARSNEPRGAARPAAQRDNAARPMNKRMNKRAG